MRFLDSASHLSLSKSTADFNIKILYSIEMLKSVLKYYIRIKKPASKPKSVIVCFMFVTNSILF